MNVCLFICPLKGFKTNGKKNADLCNDWGRFVLPTEILTRFFFLFFFPNFWEGGGLPQYAVLGSHSFLLHLNSQRTQKAEDLFLLYDLLCPWGQGQPWAEQGGHGHSPGSEWHLWAPKTCLQEHFAWQHLERGINLEEGGTSRILLCQVLGGSNISLFHGREARFCSPEVRLNNCRGQRTAECGQWDTLGCILLLSKRSSILKP